MKPAVLHTGRSLTREKLQERIDKENVYNVGKLTLEPPDELPDKAKLKFRQIVQEAFWLDSLSGDFLAIYCEAWSHWIDLVVLNASTPDVAFTENRFGEAVAKQNPYRQAMRSYALTMSEMSKMLGLSAIDRLKLLQPVTENQVKVEMPVKNPFDAFMSEVE